MRSNRRAGGGGIRRGLRLSQGGGAAYSPTSEAGYLAWFDHTYGYAKSTGALLDGRLSLLVDRSNTYTIAQGTSGNQPLWSNTGILGRAAAYYVTDDWMGTLDAALGNILDGLQAYTIYSVVDRDSAAGTNTIHCLGDSGSSLNMVQSRLRASPTGEQVVRYDAATFSQVTGTLNEGGTPARITESFSGSAYSTWVGSTADLVASACNRSVTCDRWYVGATRQAGAFASFMAGWIGDILIFTAAHDATARARVWAYLQTLYVGLA